VILRSFVESVHKSIRVRSCALSWSSCVPDLPQVSNVRSMRTLLTSSWMSSTSVRKRTRIGRSKVGRDVP